MAEAAQPAPALYARVSDRTRSKLRVVTVSDYDWPTGGVEVVVRQLLAETAAEFDHCLISWTFPEPLPNGVRLVALEHGDLNALRTALVSADVVVVMTSFNLRGLAWLATDLLRLESVPVVTVIHTSSHSGGSGPLQRSQTDQVRRLMRLSTAVVAVSQDVAHAAAVLDPDPPITVIENAARRLPTSGSPTRTRGRQNVAFIGRPHPQKGFDHFRRLADDLGGLGLHFAANTVSVAVDIDDGIACSSNLSDLELRQFYDAADVVVAPYLNSDGMPLALLEAMSCGVPIIGYDSPGVGSLLRQHHQCVVPVNYDALVETVRGWHEGRVLLRPPDPGAIRTWDESAERYVQVIRSAGSTERQPH